MGNRTDWVDCAKAIGIFLVVFSHTDVFYPVEVVIYTFHMPLFFVLSGYNFSFQRNPVFTDFVKKKNKQLMIPYFAINVITYTTWLLLGRWHGDDLLRPVKWFDPIINALMGYPTQMIHNIPIWFFMCLFVVEMFFYVLFRHRNSFVWILGGIPLLLFIAWANSALNPYDLPFMIPTALYAVVFYAFGYLLKQTNLLVRYNLIVSLGGLLVVLLVAYFNGKIAMHRNIYANSLLFFTGGIAGALFIINLSQYLSNRFRSKRIIGYLGSNTLVICGFHLQTFSVIKAIVVYVFGLSLSVFSQKIGLNILFSTISIVLCIPVIWFVNKYLPFIAGKSNSTR